MPSEPGQNAKRTFNPASVLPETTKGKMQEIVANPETEQRRKENKMLGRRSCCSDEKRCCSTGELSKRT